MLINKSVLKNLKPCVDRYKNFLEFYSDFSGNLSDFIDLSNVSYDDKIWVSVRLLTRNQLVNFKILCSESVLHIFEAKYPKDKRVRNLLTFMKTVNDYDNLSSEESEKLDKLRRECRDAYAATAYATAAAAANAAYAAAADATAAAYYATAAAYYATAARKQQQDLNLQFLKMVSEV